MADRLLHGLCNKQRGGGSHDEQRPALQLVCQASNLGGSRHGLAGVSQQATSEQIENWKREEDERQHGPGWPARPRIICPWCPHSIEEHDREGCDLVIKVAGYEYTCNCGQTPAEIREYLNAG